MRGKGFNLGAISVLLTLLVVSIAFTGGCTRQSSTGEPSPPTPSYSVLWVTIPIEVFSTHPHTDEVMHAVVGEELTVTLGSNPTTGFRWSELAEISDETVIRQVSHMYVGKEYETPPPPGTSGEEVWTFEALKEGTVTTFLEYSRPWNPEDIGVWSVTITTTIKMK